MGTFLVIAFFVAIVLACYCIYRLEYFVSRGMTDILKALKRITESLDRIESNTRDPEKTKENRDD